MQPRHRRPGPRTGISERTSWRATGSLLGLAAVVLVLVWWGAPGEAPQPSPATRAEVVPDGARAATPVVETRGAPPVRDLLHDPQAGPAVVLAAWDAARARAYARGDARALARLYVPGAVAGRRDVRLLRAYAARGLRVRGMRMDVTRLDVLRDGPRTTVLRVTDRLVGARAVRADGSSYPLPRDRPSTRVVRLVHHDGAWRVAAVGPAG